MKWKLCVSAFYLFQKKIQKFYGFFCILCQIEGDKEAINTVERKFFKPVFELNR